MRFDQVAFGCRLKEMRKERGFTQEQLAAVVNMSTVHLGNIELGKRGISIDLLQIGRASVGKECVRRCRSRWSPYH